MNRATSHSLSFSVTVFLLSVGAAQLLSPHLMAELLPWMPGIYKIFLGMAAYALGHVYFAAMVLDYAPRVKMVVRLSAGFVLAALSFLLWGQSYFAESLWLGAGALAIFFSIRLKLVLFDWLQLATMFVNGLVGIGLLLRPDLAVINMPIFDYEPMRYSMATGFLVSACIAVIVAFYSLRNHKEQWHLLSVPWLLWGLLAILNDHVLQVIVSGSIVAGLLSSEIVPWKKVILREGKSMGRRFFHVIGSGQGISLLLIIVLLNTASNLFPNSDDELLALAEIGLLNFFVVIVVGLVLIMIANLSINGIFSGLSGEQLPDVPVGREARGVFVFLRELLFDPFRNSAGLLAENARQQKEYERLLVEMGINEKRRMAQLNLLHQLNLELETVLDPPVSAQLTANAIHASMGVALCAVLQYDPERHEMMVLAASGIIAGSIPPGYRQSTQHGLIGRAARLRKSQLVSDTRLDSDYIPLDGSNVLSELVTPILFYNQLKGCIVVAHCQPQAFDDSDIRTIETIALRLVSSWQRSDHDMRMTRLIEAGVNLSTTLEVEAVLSQVSEIARQVLSARFVFVALVDKGGGFTRVAQAGYAPTLSSMLNSDPDGNSLIQTVLNQSSPVRVRDVRKRFSSTPTGSNDLRTMLALPIRLRQANIGVVLAFGKIGANAFDENDESLGNLLASQASAAIETTWLYQELRSMLNTATLLYQLSSRVIQSVQLTDAAAAIAETTYQLIQAQAAGIVLFNPQGDVEARVQIDSNGLQPGARHPMGLIRETMESGQNIILSAENELVRVSVPLQTPRHQYGALWVEVAESIWGKARFSENLHTIANQAAIALERSLLLLETRQQAEEIESAYRELETTYDQTLIALSSALDARDHETEGHSMRVTRLACMLGQFIGLDAEQLKTLERGAILHDIGKIGISDTILLKPGPLSPEEWQTMRLHPDIGARIIEGIPFLEDTLPVIRYHQERWDGSGYPLGLKGHEIPLMARIFAIIDAYDALTSDRPYRVKISTKEALEYLRSQQGKLFDPDLVDAFENLLRSRGEKTS